MEYLKQIFFCIKNNILNPNTGLTLTINEVKFLKKEFNLDVSFHSLYCMERTGKDTIMLTSYYEEVKICIELVNNPELRTKKCYYDLSEAEQIAKELDMDFHVDVPVIQKRKPKKITKKKSISKKMSNKLDKIFDKINQNKDYTYENLNN